MSQVMEVMVTIRISGQESPSMWIDRALYRCGQDCAKANGPGQSRDRNRQPSLLRRHRREYGEAGAGVDCHITGVSRSRKRDIESVGPPPDGTNIPRGGPGYSQSQLVLT